MSASAAGKAAVLLLCLSLFPTCGELDTLFPSNGSYQVKTLVNGTSLEDCSIVRANDKIRPYFAVSVVNDPDLIGLLVYLQDSQGEIVGEKIRYTLLSYADETALTEADFIEVMEEAETETEQIGETAPAEIEISEDAETVESVESESEESEEAEKTAGETAEHETAEENPVTTTTAAPEAKSTDPQEVEIAVKSLAQELPYFPLPKNLEIGPYTLVFEALGQKETLSHTETNILYLGNAEFNLKDISMYLSGLSGSQLISPGTTVMLETRLDFDSRLDPYVIWYNGKNIIREGKISEGAGKLLWTAPEQAGFYSLRMEALPFYLKRRNNFIGLSREIALPVSPKAVSLGYFFENNPEYTARSPLSAGTAYPEQVQLIMAMAAAEAPVEDSAEKPAENSVDEKAEEASTLIPPSPPELLQWYQFEGSLRNTVPAPTSRQTLIPSNESSPRWAAAGQSYGLSTGPDDPYLFSPINFFRDKKKEEGGGILLLHIRPPTEGIIFNALFPLRSSSTNGVWIDMIKEKNVIALRLRAEGTTVEIPLYFTASGTEGFIPVVVEFYIRPYRLEAKISMDGNLQNGMGSINFSGALSGEGRIRLGGILENFKLKNNSTLALAASTPDLTERQSEEIPFEMITETDSAEEINAPAVVETFTSNTIWDELAILYSTVPLLPEELPEEAITEQDTAVDAVTNAAVSTDVNIETVEKKTETSPAPAVQPEVDVDTKPAAVELPTSDSATENSSAEVVDGETIKAEEAEKIFSPATDTDTDDSIREQEMQERTLTVLSENS